MITIFTYHKLGNLWSRGVPERPVINHSTQVMRAWKLIILINRSQIYFDWICHFHSLAVCTFVKFRFIFDIWSTISQVCRLICVYSDVILFALYVSKAAITINPHFFSQYMRMTWSIWSFFFLELLAQNPFSFMYVNEANSCWIS